METLESRCLLSSPILPNLAITTDPGVQQMPSIAVDPLDTNHLVVAYMDRSLVDTGYAGIGAAVSRDGGSTWQRTSLALTDGFNQGAANPMVRFDNQGRVYIGFMAATYLAEQPALTLPGFTNPVTRINERAWGLRSNNGIFVARSDDGGASWGQPVAVVSHLYTGTKVPFDAIPFLAVDSHETLLSGQPNPRAGRLYVTWTRFYAAGQYPGVPAAKGGTDIMIAVSDDAGATWTTQLQPGPAGVPVSVIQDRVNNPVAAPEGLGYVDQARLAIGPNGEVYLSNYGAGDFTVHCSIDGGASFAMPDHGTGSRCAFGKANNTNVNEAAFPNNLFRTHAARAIAADPLHPGQVYAAEMFMNLDAFGKEIDPIDIVFARSTDTGVTWDPAFQFKPQQMLNDDNDRKRATGLDANEVTAAQAMPRMVVDEQGRIGVIWYDNRRDPAGHLLDVFGTISSDGGRTWSPNFRITTLSLDAYAGRFTDALGAVDFSQF